MSHAQTVMLRIFVIEDDDDARSTLEDILQLDDHDVTTAATAKDALADNRFADADVVLLDRKLPDGMAEELLPRLRRASPHASFIVITAYADMTAAIAALREGVSDFLIKPIDPDVLRAGLARLAGRLDTERELYKQRRFAEKLLDTAEAIVVVLSPTGEVVRTNNYLLELTGYTLDEVIGCDWIATFVPERDRARVRQVFEDTVSHIKSRGIVNAILKKDGGECDIRWSNSTLRDVDGVTTAVLSVGLDVTDFVAAQGRLLQQERLAAIGETMTGLAHESRNALQKLQNAVNLLQRRLSGDEIALKDIAKIERAGAHIRDLLDEVRAYAAPIVLATSDQPIPPIWRRAWESLEGTGQTKLQEHVDHGVELQELPIDGRRLQQVFRNLFENAMDAHPDHAAITITASMADDHVVITFADNGPGVKAEHRESIFDAFATTKPTGTGLGLAICQRVIESHQGAIRLLDSKTGACFEIRLPINATRA